MPKKERSRFRKGIILPKTMPLDKTTAMLFNRFPREVGKTRRRIYNMRQLIDYIESANGYEDVYTSVYSLDFRIDKIFIDLDGKNAFNDLKAIARFFESEGLQYIPVASGKKGYHLYLLLKPKKYKNSKQLLRAVTFYIIEQVFGKNNLASVDPTKIGDIRALCRVQNTLRPPENLNYCTYLPPSFFDLTEKDVAFHIKSPHTYDYGIDPRKLPTLDFFDVDVEKYAYNANANANNDNLKLTTNIKNIKDIKAYLKTVLRPCLYNRIIQPDPEHLVRVATTIDLLQFLSEKQVFEIYARLKWRDWNPEITAKQIKYATKYLPYSCRRLRQLGIPKACCE